MKNIIITSIFILLYISSFADGIIISSDDNYPGTILKNKSTSVEVNIDGLIVKTTSTQEFCNEWNEVTNGVYSFPVPLNARVTRLMYSKGDTLVDAVLKAIPQSTNPGTGEGGLVAEINEYMGKNVVRLQLTNIPPNGIKWVKIEYISEMRHYNGTCEYSYPFDTEGFYTTPLDYLSVEINVHSQQTITDFDLTSHQDYNTILATDNDVSLFMIKPLEYQASDIKFEYTVENSNLKIDLHTWNSDTTDGYFTLVGRPMLNPTNYILPTNIVFLIENSTTMNGDKLSQSKLAVIEALDNLSLRDSFNIAYFNYNTTFWETEPVVANATNIANAKIFVEGINASGGSNIQTGLISALQNLSNTTTTSSIIAFTDGVGYLYPEQVENANTNKTGIFFISFTDYVDRLRLESTAMLNYGFVTYLNNNSILSSEMVKVFKKINRPLLKDVEIEFNSPDVYDLYPTKFPAIYGDSDFKITGRYLNSGDATITISGDNEEGHQSIDFDVNFASSSDNDNARCLWVRNAIDELESDILIYGEDDYKKAELIELSLREKTRCRYTAYVEDTTYANFTDSIFFDDEPLLYISENNLNESKVNIYPNPVFENLTIEIDNSEFKTNTSKLIKFYDITGKLIYTINFSSYKNDIYKTSIHKSVFKTNTNLIIMKIEIDGKAIKSKTIILG